MTDRDVQRDPLLAALGGLAGHDVPDERAASLEAKLLQAFGARHAQSTASATRHLETGLVAAGAVAWFAWAVGTLRALSG